jgi:hypothetical protein
MPGLTAFFERLAGSDADINAVFELGEEEDSALDTREYPGLQPVEASRQRHMSPGRPSPRRRSNTSTHRPNVSRSPRQNDPPHSTSSSPILTPSPSPRRHVPGIIKRGTEIAQSYTSPLAQVFQPLVVDDFDSEAVADISEPEPSTGPSSGVSYGPASRRRLSSARTHAPTDIASQGSVLRKFPTVGSGPRFNVGDAQQLSESPSPDRSAKFRHDSPEEQKVDANFTSWTWRLEKMEERQLRIEDLLIQLVEAQGRRH